MFFICGGMSCASGDFMSICVPDDIHKDLRGSGLAGAAKGMEARSQGKEVTKVGLSSS